MDDDLLKVVGEPVAWMYVNTDGECEQIEYGKDTLCDGFEPLYTEAQLQILVKQVNELSGYKEAWVEAQRGRSAAERELSALKVEVMELRAAALKGIENYTL